jgi:hypothetical protein
MNEIKDMAYNELRTRYIATGEQWELLNRGLVEALAVDAPDVMLHAHIGSLQYNLRKLAAEYDELGVALAKVEAARPKSDRIFLKPLIADLGKAIDIGEVAPAKTKSTSRLTG